MLIESEFRDVFIFLGQLIGIVKKIISLLIYPVIISVLSAKNFKHLHMHDIISMILLRDIFDNIPFHVLWTLAFLNPLALAFHWSVRCQRLHFISLV